MGTRKIPQRFTPELRSEIVERYLGGESCLAIAPDYDTNRWSIAEIVKAAGVKMRSPGQDRKFDEDARNEIVERYKNGESGNSIASHFGTTRNTVLSVVRAAGLSVRGQGNEYRDLSEEELTAITTMWDEGKSRAYIASHVNTSYARVGHALTLAGYTLEQRWLKGPDNASWKGGRLNSHGYIRVRLPFGDPYFPMADLHGYLLEHRWVMARSLGRLLTKEEQVHHINGDKTDNRLANLQLHVGNHGKGRVMVCADCGSHNVVPERIQSEPN